MLKTDNLPSLGVDGTGLLIPPLLWNVVPFVGPSTVLALFCDEPSDAADYLRDRDEYMRLKLGHGRGKAMDAENVLSGKRPAAEGQMSDFDLAMATAEHPDLLQALVETARRTFGYYDEYLPYIIMYPWVANRVQGLGPGSRVIDLGAGITPMPVYFAAKGMLVETVDRSEITRSFPVDDTWNGWGFFDYGTVDTNIRSHHCRAEEFVPDGKYEAVYSIGMIAHMARNHREDLLRKITAWLRPGGRFLFSVDMVRATDYVWNRYEDKEVEPLHEHGIIGDIRSQLESLGYRIHEFRILREPRGSRTDILLVDCSTPAA